ncbi:MAG: Wzz/FepE/Etk N-terminal domain-containing protein [Synergistaceae bacterium]|nr:Wzz/FepE/Etk N-terminal domain-containing protein [Synergistaceae bacterium]
MTDSQKTLNDDYEYELSLLDLLVILVQQRWLIIKITAAFVIIAVIYALTATPIYRSTMQIISPNSGAKSGAAAMLAATGMGDMLGGQLTTQSDTVVGVIKSPLVLDRVIDKNSLLTRESENFSIGRLIGALFSKGGSKPKMRTMVRRSLSESVQAISDKKSGIITLSVKDTSPDMAVKLVKSIFAETLCVMQDVAISPSEQQRVFLESQLKENNRELSKAEGALVTFQKRTGMIGTGGAPNDISALAVLQAQMVAKEIELRSTCSFAKEANPQIKKLEAEYAAIKKQFEADNAKVGTFPLSGVGLKNLPVASLEYAALVREYKFRENLGQILLRQYETARMNELNDPLVFQALGEPTYPELKESPKRAKIVILAAFLGGFLGVLAAFISHFLSISSSDPEEAPKIEFVKEALRSDLKKLKFLKKKSL